MTKCATDKSFPEFQSWYSKMVFRGIGVGAATLIGCMAFKKTGLNELSILSLLIFICSAIFLFVYITFIIKNISCPDCANTCSSHKDKLNREWVAKCDACNINWHLGIGTNSKNW